MFSRSAWELMLNWLRGRASDSRSIPDIQRLLQEADRLRDERKWAQAAEAYRRVLAVCPDLDPIWIQLGHALKEVGDSESAEIAYKRATEINPRSLDGYVQLGHAQKNSSQTAAAISSFASALEINPFCPDALRELISLGKGSVAGAKTNVGFHLLAEVHSSVLHLKKATRDIERMLPDIYSLCSVPATNYSVFAERFQLPAPPERVQSIPWSAVVIDDGVSDILRTIRSVLQQRDWQSIDITCARPGLDAELAQISNLGLSCPLRLLDPAVQAPIVEADWLLLVKAGAELMPLALPWMKWAAAQVDSCAIYADEELVDCRENGEISSRGYFKAAYDVEAGGSCYGHALLAIRSEQDRQGRTRHLGDPSAIDLIERCAAIEGRIAHLPRVLSRRKAPPHIRKLTLNTIVHTNVGKIVVVIPTRNGGEALKSCIDAAMTLADGTDLIDFVVMDNGSTETVTCDYLKKLAARPGFSVLRDTSPFNWAHLNNRGVKASSSQLLLFMNDDVELLSKSWDSHLRDQLARPDIGALGCKLLYPDGRIQHAGIVFGPDDRTAHEGAGDVTTETRHRWNCRRTVGAVTGAFLATRREVFDAMEGFNDVSFPIWFNDVDFCLRLRSGGLRILFDPEICGMHRESMTLRKMPATRTGAIWDQALKQMHQTWGAMLLDDPSFNPHFLRRGKPFEAIMEPSPELIRAHLHKSSSPNLWR